MRALRSCHRTETVLLKLFAPVLSPLDVQSLTADTTAMMLTLSKRFIARYNGLLVTIIESGVARLPSSDLLGKAVSDYVLQSLLLLVKAHALIARHAPAQVSTLIKLLTGALLQAMQRAFEQLRPKKRRLIQQCTLDVRFIEAVLGQQHFTKTAQGLAARLHEMLSGGGGDGGDSEPRETSSKSQQRLDETLQAQYGETRLLFECFTAQAATGASSASAPSNK